MELSVKDIQDILGFLNRTQLAGNEALRMVQLQQKLVDTIKSQEKPKEDKSKDIKEEKK